MSVAGKADSAAYAASLSDRGTWEWEQMANLAREGKAASVTSVAFRSVSDYK